MRLWPFSGGITHSGKLVDGDEHFDLDDPEYAFEFGKNERVLLVAGLGLPKTGR